MFFGCIFVFYYLFCYMEVCGVLDIINEFYMVVFYYMFLFCINRNLFLFVEGYNRGLFSIVYNKLLE